MLLSQHTGDCYSLQCTHKRRNGGRTAQDVEGVGHLHAQNPKLSSQLCLTTDHLCNGRGRTAQDVVGVGHLYALAVREGHVAHAARGRPDRIGLVRHLRLAHAVELECAACDVQRRPSNNVPIARTI